MVTGRRSKQPGAWITGVQIVGCFMGGGGRGAWKEGRDYKAGKGAVHRCGNLRRTDAMDRACFRQRCTLSVEIVCGGGGDTPPGQGFLIRSPVSSLSTEPLSHPQARTFYYDRRSL